MWCVYYTHHTIVFGWAKRAPNHCSKSELYCVPIYHWNFNLFGLDFIFLMYIFLLESYLICSLYNFLSVYVDNFCPCFFLIHFIHFFWFHTLVFFIQPNNMKVLHFFHFQSFKDAHELESRYDSSNASVLETKNGGRSKKKKKKPARCIKCKQANRKIWTIGQSTSVCVLLGLAIFVTGILNLD